MFTNSLIPPTSFVSVFLQALPAKDPIEPYDDGCRWANLHEAAEFIDESGYMETLHDKLFRTARSEFTYLSRCTKTTELQYTVIAPCQASSSPAVMRCIDEHWSSTLLGVTNKVSFWSGDDAARVFESFCSESDTDLIVKQFRIFRGRAATFWMSPGSDPELKVVTGLRLATAESRHPRDAA